MGKAEKEKRLLVMRKLFHREYNYSKLKRMNAPVAIMEKSKSMVENTRKELLDLGVSTKQYKQFAVEYSLEFEAREMSISYMEQCLTSIRHVQAYQKKSKGLNPRFSCPLIGQSKAPTYCSPFCRSYAKATDEQRSDFEHLIDLETGQHFDVSALDKEMEDFRDSKD